MIQSGFLQVNFTSSVCPDIPSHGRRIRLTRLQLDIGWLWASDKIELVS